MNDSLSLIVLSSLLVEHFRDPVKVAENLLRVLKERKKALGELTDHHCYKSMTR